MNELLNLYHLNQDEDFIKNDYMNNPIYKYNEHINRYIFNLVEYLNSKVEYNNSIYKEQNINLENIIKYYIKEDSALENFNKIKQEYYYGLYPDRKESMKDFFIDLITISNNFKYLFTEYKNEPLKLYKI